MSERAAAEGGGARGRLRRLALPAACGLMGGASLIAAIVMFASAGGWGQRVVPGAVLAVATAVWLTGTLQVHTLDLKASHVRLFLGLLVMGVIASLSINYRLPAGVDTFQAYQGYPWYCLMLGAGGNGRLVVSGVDGLGALGDVIFWAGVSVIVLGWMIVAGDTTPAAE